MTASQRHVIPLQGRPYEEDQVIYDGDDDDDDDGDEDDDDDGGDHLGELNQPGVGAKGRCSSLPSAERLLLSTN